MILQIPLLLYYILQIVSIIFFSVYIATPFMTSGMSSSSLFSLLKLPFMSALTSSIENEE